MDNNNEAESSRPDHRAQVYDTLSQILASPPPSFRIGLSGAPGVGKSSFIETFGTHVIQQGHKVAVLVREIQNNV
jgi:LAO/AO transport system kinase